MLNRSDLEKQYISGKRSFYQANLEQVDLENMFLSRIEMKQANLNYANLNNADLSDADLAQSFLIGTQLDKAHLSGIDLTQANLTQAKFTKSILNQANFAEACLEEACLIGAALIGANFAKANLSGASLLGANLSGANFEGAFYDSKTVFPPDFDPVGKKMIDKLSIQDLISQFEHLCTCSTKYLGNTMTAKYFESSRPKSDWLAQFTLNKSSQIIYQKDTAQLATPKQTVSFQQWQDAFTESCSLIIKGFKNLI